MTTTQRKPAVLDAHPNVIGRAEVLDEYTVCFDTREYIVTGKTGHSIHDGTPVEEYHHDETGHRIWKDAQDRVHADSHSDAMEYRNRLA